MTDTKPKPVHGFRLGKCRAAVWDNTTDKGARYNVTFSKLYLDKDGKWRDTSSFGRGDLLLLAELARQTASFLYQKEVGPEKPEEAEEPDEE